MHITQTCSPPPPSTRQKHTYVRTHAHTQVFFYALAFEPTGPVVHALFQLMYAVRNWYVWEGKRGMCPLSACYLACVFMRLSTFILKKRTHTHTHT